MGTICGCINKNELTTFTICIKTKTGIKISFKVLSNNTIKEIKEKIQNKHNEMLVEQQKLLFNDQPLENDKTLKHYSIKNNFIIHLILPDNYSNTDSNNTDSYDDDSDKFIETFPVTIKTIVGMRFEVNVKPITTIHEIKVKIENQQRGMPAYDSKLIFGSTALENDNIVSDYNLETNSVIILLLFAGGPKNQDDNEHNKKYEHLEMDKVRDIKISRDSFRILIRKSLNNKKFPTVISDILYSFSKCIGGNKNYKSKFNQLHGVSTIQETEKLLKDQFYIDQWTDTGLYTPLFEVVRAKSVNVELAEFFIINGARRKIKAMIKELNKTQSNLIPTKNSIEKRKLLDILMPYADQDPFIYTVR